MEEEYSCPTTLFFSFLFLKADKKMQIQREQGYANIPYITSK